MTKDKKKLLKSLIKQYLTQAKQENVDFSKFEKRFAAWLKNDKGIKVLQKIIQDNPPQEAKKKLVDTVEKVIKDQGLVVSSNYLAKFKNTIERLNSETKLMQYIYDVYLKGIGLGV